MWHRRIFSTHAIAGATADAMMAALKNRGPDAQHSKRWHADWRTAPADGTAHNALIHARLSIIDPRPIADQPMYQIENTVRIEVMVKSEYVGNGELRELLDFPDEILLVGKVRLSQGLDGHVPASELVASAIHDTESAYPQHRINSIRAIQDGTDG